MERIIKLNQAEKMLKSNKPQYSICKICKVKYARQSNVLRPTCTDHNCMTKYGLLLLENKKKKENRDKEKHEREQTKEMKAKLLTHKDYIKLFQTVFNTYIRLRDKDKPCVSCRNPYADQYDAGHFIATTKQFLRFHEDNVHGQCRKCNRYMVGNIIPYRIELINRIGIERVEWLESNAHRNLELSIPEIQEQIRIYKQKIKELKTL